MAVITPLDRVGAALVASGLRSTALALWGTDSQAASDEAIAWLTGAHESYGDLWAALPSEVRAAMKRAACDLVFAMPAASDAAASALCAAADLVQDMEGW